MGTQSPRPLETCGDQVTRTPLQMLDHILKYMSRMDPDTLKHYLKELRDAIGQTVQDGVRVK